MFILHESLHSRLGACPLSYLTDLPFDLFERALLVDYISHHFAFVLAVFFVTFEGELHPKLKLSMFCALSQNYDTFLRVIFIILSQIV